tara:strand:- start:132 stop:419 length:288 start_codon:yes stop_codon:yes gene_type:complete
MANYPYLTVVGASNASLGQAGGQLIQDGDTATYVGPFVAITALSTCVFDFSESEMGFITGMDPLAVDFTLRAGLTIYGRFEEVTLASGDAILYKG